MLVKKIFIICLLLSLPSVHSFGMGFRAKYIPIDSLIDKYIGASVLIDLKEKTINYCNSTFTIPFQQHYSADSIHRFVPLSLTYQDSVGINYFMTGYIIELSQDSIFVTVQYFKNDFKGRKIIKTKKHERYGVAKQDLNGVVIGPTKKESKRYFISLLSMGVSVSVLSFLFGGHG